MKQFLLILMTCALALGLYAQISAGDAQPCPGLTTVTDYDGNVYNTVKIGTQCWMKQNLRTAHFANGDTIYAGGSFHSDTIPYLYISFLNMPFLLSGYFYNWAAAMHGASSSDANPSGVQGICPNGWHLPSKAEWMKLNQYMSQNSSVYICSNLYYSGIARALSSTSWWNSYGDEECYPGNQMEMNNASGFSAFPAGKCYYNGIYGRMEISLVGQEAGF